MEKKPNSLDRLFAEKLRHYEATPRPAVWEKLKTRLPQQTPERARPLWGYWAVAASVAALVLSGIWAWQSKVEPAAANEIVQAEASTRHSAEPKDKGAVNSSSQIFRSTESGVAPLGERFPLNLAKAHPARAERLAQIVPQSAVPSDRIRAKGGEPVEPLIVTPTAILPVPQVAYTPVPPVVPTEKVAVVVVPKVYVLHVTEPAILAAELTAETQLVQAEPVKPKKEKFFNRLVRNVKHLKQGEWKEAGLDAGGLLARAEDKILRK